MGFSNFINSPIFLHPQKTCPQFHFVVSKSCSGSIHLLLYPVQARSSGMARAGFSGHRNSLGTQGVAKPAPCLDCCLSQTSVNVLAPQPLRMSTC